MLRSYVMDGCGSTNADGLEALQLEAARILTGTGMPLFASRESLYYETGLEPLQLKLMFLHKIQNGFVPTLRFSATSVISYRCLGH